MSIVVERKDRVVVITIDRQRSLNALDPESMAELRDAIDAFNRDDDAWVAVLTGAGDKAFCSGADIGTTKTASLSAAEILFSNDAEAKAERYVETMDFGDLKVWKPVIAAVNGYALGGGFELALWCDIRIAASNASLGLPEVRIGSIPAIGGIRRLMNAVSSSNAMYALLSGRHIGADEALRIGLVSEVVNSERLLDRALEMATEIAHCAPLAVRAAKMLSIRGRDLAIEHAIELEQIIWAMLKSTNDRLEGRQAFLEKRAPRFEGR